MTSREMTPLGEESDVMVCTGRQHMTSRRMTLQREDGDDVWTRGAEKLRREMLQRGM